MDVDYYIVEAADETYHHTPDEGANAHRIGLPIVAGPYETWDEAAAHLNNGLQANGEVVVALPEGHVPDDWNEE